MSECRSERRVAQKKLTELGEFWARSDNSPSPESVRAELENLGADEALIQRVIRTESGKYPDIYEENLSPWEIFLDCASQWRIIAGMSVVFQGLDYAGLQSVFWFHDIPKQEKKSLFHSIQIIENGALRELNKSG